MLPALKNILSAIVCIFFCNFALFQVSACAQDTDRFTSLVYAFSRSPDVAMQDEVERELALYGKSGLLISQARAHTLFILSSENSCSNWYRQARPHPDEMFQTLRFAVDSSGQSEIFKVEGASGDFEFFHPYVAHAGQNVGPGSTITINASGAFFKDHAIVRPLNGPADPFSKQFRRVLTVADFWGDTQQARILTLLHEFAHVLDMLPVDYGSPSSAFLSVENTKAVLKNCKSQIELEAKQSRAITRKLPQASLTVAEQTPSDSLRPLPTRSTFRPRQ
jgi:hypothetical protein